MQLSTQRSIASFVFSASRVRRRVSRRGSRDLRPWRSRRLSRRENPAGTGKGTSQERHRKIPTTERSRTGRTGDSKTCRGDPKHGRGYLRGVWGFFARLGQPCFSECQCFARILGPLRYAGAETSLEGVFGAHGDQRKYRKSNGKTGLS